MRRSVAGVYFRDGKEDIQDGSRRLPPCTVEMQKKWEGRSRVVAGDGDRSGSGSREPRDGGQGGRVTEAAVEVQGLID